MSRSPISRGLAARSGACGPLRCGGGRRSRPQPRPRLATSRPVADDTRSGERKLRRRRHASPRPGSADSVALRIQIRRTIAIVAPVGLTLFDSGTLTMGGVTVPVPFFLIRHPDGNVLVDGGNPLAVARDPAAHWGALAERFRVTMTEEQHCEAQLRAHGVKPASIRYVLQTHLHIDHTGALGHFPDAGVVVSRRELEAARAVEAGQAAGYVRADIDRPRLDWQPFDGDLDLFDDGTVRAIASPGHSAGHASVLVRLPRTGMVMLTGDASDTRRQFDGRARPRALFSPEEASRSLERLRLLARETDALVVPGHDPGVWARLRRAPDTYD